MAIDVNTLGVQFRTIVSSKWDASKAKANIFYRVIDDTSKKDVAFYLGNQLLSNQDNLDALSAKVNTLIGSDVNKSVRTIAAEELAAQLIPSDAQESLNTLEEIAAWIQEHPGDAATMNQQIQTNKDNITKIVNGTTTVAKASHAETAGSATTATTAGSATTAATASNAEKLGGQSPSYYATASDLTSGLAGKANASEVYKKTETYTQSEVNTKLDEKANKATTLAGYGIADAYTQTQVNNLLNNKADKSNTYTNDEVDAELDKKANAADVYTTAQADAKFVETVSGKAGSANGTIKLTVDGVDSADIAVAGLGTAAFKNEGAFATAAQGAKADTAVQSVATGEANGTIKVDGNEVSVAGLKSAAYHDAGSFATANQGAKADSALQQADIASGTNNGTIKVKGTDVAVTGLGTAAYKGEGYFATSAQGAKADSALQPEDITTGVNAGTIKVDGTEVKVAGLGTAAYQNTGAFDAVGAATTAKNEVIGASGDAATANTIYGAKAYAYDVAISGAASALNQANANIAGALSWVELGSME